MNAARWQSLSDWPLIGAAVLFLVAYAWQVLGDLQGAQWEFAELVMTLTWVLFTIDYVVRLVLAKHRLKWFVVICSISQWSPCRSCGHCG